MLNRSPRPKPELSRPHTGDVHVARGRVTRDLNVADDGAPGGDVSLVEPSETVVSREPDGDAPALEVVPGNVHSPEEGRTGVIIGPARFALVKAAGMNTEMGPASRVRGIGGLEPAEGAALVPVQLDRKPSLG